MNTKNAKLTVIQQLQHVELPVPIPVKDQVLVKVEVASVNCEPLLDWYRLLHIPAWS
jgi:NADPH:quinone reductase-like Zn-dependent oxidoreductase